VSQNMAVHRISSFAKFLQSFINIHKRVTAFLHFGRLVTSWQILYFWWDCTEKCVWSS